MDVGNDVLVKVGNDSITLKDAAVYNVRIIGTPSKSVVLTNGDDYHRNNINEATIAALGGNDFIRKGFWNFWLDEDLKASISGDEDDDIIYNWGSQVTIDGGTGDDEIGSLGDDIIIDGGAGNDIITNFDGLNATMRGGSGDDRIVNFGNENGGVKRNGSNTEMYVGQDGNIHVETTGKIDEHHYAIIDNKFANDGNLKKVGDSTNIFEVNAVKESIDDLIVGKFLIEGGAGKDDITNNHGSNGTINGGDGDDYIQNLGAFITIDGGEGDNDVVNEGANVIIKVGAGNDSVWNMNKSPNVMIHTGDGNDTITNHDGRATINAGADNDIITFAGNDAINNVIEYSAGNGRDTVFGFGSTDTLRIGNGTGTYSTQTNGKNIIVKVDTGSVTLFKAASLSAVNIQGVRRESGAEDRPVTLTEGNDTYNNTLEGATVQALGGDDTITNSGDNVSVDGGANNDRLNNSGNNVQLTGGTGNDVISNSGRATATTLSKALTILQHCKSATAKAHTQDKRAAPMLLFK